MRSFIRLWKDSDSKGHHHHHHQKQQKRGCGSNGGFYKTTVYMVIVAVVSCVTAKVSFVVAVIVGGNNFVLLQHHKRRCSFIYRLVWEVSQYQATMALLTWWRSRSQLVTFLIEPSSTQSSFLLFCFPLSSFSLLLLPLKVPTSVPHLVLYFFYSTYFVYIIYDPLLFCCCCCCYAIGFNSCTL